MLADTIWQHYRAVCYSKSNLINPYCVHTVTFLRSCNYIVNNDKKLIRLDICPHHLGMVL